MEQGRKVERSARSVNQDLPASGMYFMTYEWLKCVLTPEGQ
ncbi:hypothetical protein scyTo_0025121, partial [Scyliorhinus torazame]|nr:hypothetical protein [Scyliorhinus torazame]